MIRLRNNYVYIHNQYVKATTGVVLNFENVSANDIEMFYDIGVAWMFINAIKGDSYHGNTFEAFDMGVKNYLSYITSVLGIDYSKSKKYASFHSKDDSDAAFLEQYRISRSQIKFSEGKKYMKALSDVEVESADFRYIMNAHSDGFIYLDSPYFLTTDYQIPFRDSDYFSCNFSLNEYDSVNELAHKKAEGEMEDWFCYNCDCGWETIDL